jgi:hypothetical protein
VGIADQFVPFVDGNLAGDDRMKIATTPVARRSLRGRLSVRVGGRTAEQRDEVAAVHSITSSARESA